MAANASNSTKGIGAWASLRSRAPALLKRLVWDYKHRDRTIAQQRCPRAFLDQLDGLGPDEAVLDLGCATGDLRAALRERGWRGRFIGVDVSRHAIETAKSANDDNAEWHVGAIEAFPIEQYRVGAVCLCEAIYYVELARVPDLLDRCKMATRSGGQVVVRIFDAEVHAAYCTALERFGAMGHGPLYVIQI